MRTKRTTFVALVAILLLLAGTALWIVTHPPPSPPPVAIGFLGFTNSNSGAAQAVFGITNPPNAGLTVHSVTLTNDVGSVAQEKQRGAFEWATKLEWGLPIGITVDTTNQPLSVVFAFQLRKGGPRRLLERLQEYYVRLRGSEVSYFTGDTFFVTNQTRIGVNH
jgi:hypothetical protein